ncbi:MAG: 23S rRNA (guanosine(2251)-2'-O)-methyltransferase RlmB [Oscillospiraceae bacterium]|nr:23S rRNA (guanosine(2251)-2'-O)-methyltransferase RlmB [Oscillospiraceae bacterium]
MENNLIICGKNAVTEALRSGQTANALYVADGAKGIGEQIALAKAANVVIKQVTLRKLDEMSEGTRHGGVALALSAVEYVGVADILASSPKAFVLICDGIEDPHNLGALIRTAEAAGVSGVIIPKRRGVAVTAAVYTASAGAAAHMKIARVTNLTDAIRELKEAGVWVYGAEADGQDYSRVDFSTGGGAALVIGSEGRGLSRLVRDNCDFVVGVPMHGKINSLNASACGAVLMFAVAGSRTKHGKEGGKLE